MIEHVLDDRLGEARLQLTVAQDIPVPLARKLIAPVAISNRALIQSSGESVPPPEKT